MCNAFRLAPAAQEYGGSVAAFGFRRRGSPLGYCLILKRLRYLPAKQDQDQNVISKKYNKLEHFWYWGDGALCR